MKKLSLFLAIVLMFLTFSACGCEHQWEEATCLTPKTCTLCGETEGELAAHLFSAATCTTPKTCDVCGKTQGDAAGHSFEDATCTSPNTCTKCGFKEGEALGHTWEPATYEKPSTCSVCGETTGEKLTPPSEWGFYNLEEMGNALIPIAGGIDLAGDSAKRDILSPAENLENIEKGFVIVTGEFITFKNGYIFSSEIVYETGSYSFSNPISPRAYQIIDNNILKLEYSTFSIPERKTFGSDIVLLRKSTPMNTNGYYIPYSLIDWDRGVELNDDWYTGGEQAYKLYIKQ